MWDKSYLFNFTSSISNRFILLITFIFLSTILNTNTNGVFSRIFSTHKFNKKLLQAPTVLETPEINDIGLWTAWDRCPRGNYIFGMRIQFLPPNTVDNEGLVGIKLLCGEPYNRRIVKKEVGFEESTRVSGGIWTQNEFCNGPATGLLVRNGQSKKSDDQVGITNVQLNCPNPNEIIKPKLAYQPGDWSTPLTCDSKKQALCGIQVQQGAEISSGEVDGVGINRIRVECCDILAPEETCVPWDRMETLFEYDNSQGLHPANYRYTKRVGVSKTNGLTTIEKNRHKFTLGVKPKVEAYLKAGAEFGNLGGLQAKFHLDLLKGKGANFQWHNAASDTWQAEKSSTVSVIIEPGYRLRIYQIVGYCGDFVVRPDFIYQNGTFVETHKRGIIDSSGQRRLRFAWKVALGIITSALSASHVYFG